MAKKVMTEDSAIIVPEMGVMPVSGPIVMMSPYVSFVSVKSEAFATKVAMHYPDLQDGWPLLFCGGDKPIKLDPMKFLLVHMQVHWSSADSNGEIVKSILDPELVDPKNRDVKENLETVLLIYEGNRLVPARCTFRSTKTRAGWIAKQTLDYAKDDATWAKLSPEHQASLAVKDARFRFYTQVKLAFGNVSKSNGFKYTIAGGIPKVTTLEDWKLIKASFEDPAFRKTLDHCISQFQERMTYVRSKSV